MMGPKYGLNLCYCNCETNNPQMNAHFLWKCIGIYLLLYYLKTDPHAISTNFNTRQDGCCNLVKGSLFPDKMSQKLFQLTCLATVLPKTIPQPADSLEQQLSSFLLPQYMEHMILKCVIYFHLDMHKFPRGQKFPLPLMQE